MKTHTLLTIVLVLTALSVLVACSSRPSESLIQTAIAQTRAVEPTATNVPASPTSLPTRTPAPSPTMPPTPTRFVTATPSPTATQLPVIERNETQKIGPILNSTRDESYTVEITLKSIQWSMGDKYNKPKSGNIYAIVTVRVKNLGPSPSRNVGQGDFQVLDANGRLIDEYYETIIKECDFETVDLIAGGNAEGCFLFEVPVDGKVELVYAPFKYEGLKPGRYLSFTLR